MKKRFNKIRLPGIYYLNIIFTKYELFTNTTALKITEVLLHPFVIPTKGQVSEIQAITRDLENIQKI